MIRGCCGILESACDMFEVSCHSLTYLLAAFVREIHNQLKLEFRETQGDRKKTDVAYDRSGTLTGVYNR